MTNYSGILYIISFSSDRDGYKKDVDTLETTFKEMKAKVEVKIDPTQEELDAFYNELLTKNYEDYLYVAVAWNSHGHEDDVGEITVPNAKRSVTIQKRILIPLCNNTTLNNKLKWLIVQACKGARDFIKQKPEGPKPIIEYPNYCVKFFSTSEGTYSWRETQPPIRGAIFIVALCDALRNGYQTRDLVSIMETATQAVEERCRNLKTRFIQKPSIEQNLGTLKFSFTSGIQ